MTTWSALDLTWAGVAFGDLAHRAASLVQPHPRARWLLVSGLDGFQSCLLLEDALAEDVLMADELDGVPLSSEHGAPMRLLAPAQYGYKSVKHLARLEYCRAYPGGSAGWKEHPRGRVAREERSRLLPGPIWRRAWALPHARRFYRTHGRETTASPAQPAKSRSAPACRRRFRDGVVRVATASRDDRQGHETRRG